MIHTKVYEPGNGTRYVIVFGEIQTASHGVPFVALPDFGKAATMSIHPSEWGYVADKLKLNKADAQAVYDALNEGA